jgi:hypothetical protein
VLREVYEKEGVAGFYKGITALPVLCLQPAIQITIFDRVKTMLLATPGSKLTAVQAFWLGAGSRAIAICAIYPYLRAKTVLQTRKKAGAGGGKEETITDIVMGIIKRNGFADLYVGLQAELVRAVLSSALMFMISEQVRSAFEFPFLSFVSFNSYL